MYMHSCIVCLYIQTHIDTYKLDIDIAMHISYKDRGIEIDG